MTLIGGIPQFLGSNSNALGHSKERCPFVKRVAVTDKKMSIQDGRTRTMTKMFITLLTSLYVTKGNIYIG